MAQQVKFYSTATLPASPNAGGVYFVDGGELYKGSQRFGLGRVTNATTSDALIALKATAARGDINVGFEGAKVYDGSAWQPLGGDIASLQSSWQSDIKTWTGSLASGDSASYIAYIDKNGDGKLTAHAVAFPTLATGDADGQVKLGTTNATVSGWSAVKTDIANLKAVVSYSGTGTKAVTADTGTFTNLTVTNTATFSATEVSAGSLTVGGVSVNNVAASSATGSNNGVAVTVSTLGGGVNAVGVAVTGNLATFAGKSVVTTVGPATGDNAASDDNIATEKAVRDAIASLDKVMHFKGVVKVLPTTGNTDGDIVVIGASPTGDDPDGKKLVAGQEYIYDGTKWEKIGDQSAVTGGGDSKNANGITIGVDTAPATASATVTLTVAAVSTAADVSAQGTATNVVTAGAVAGFVTGITDTKAQLGTGNAAGGHGISGQVVLASNVKPELTITVDAITASADVATGVDKVVTAGAVADYVTGTVNGLDAEVSSSENNSIKVGVTQVNGKVTAVTADILWLDANGDPITTA